uniref:Uncharacterized protein n=1 Tax=Anguilla anguilla TaxID=7936 RepID=A0A0E9QLK3_ANGAN
MKYDIHKLLPESLSVVTVPKQMIHIFCSLQKEQVLISFLNLYSFQKLFRRTTSVNPFICYSFDFVNN